MADARLRVLHIVEGFDGGVVTFLRYVLPELVAAGLDVSLVCSPRRGPEQAEDVAFLARAGVRLHMIRMTNGLHPWRDFSALISLVELIRRQPFHLIHTHCFKAGVLGRVAARYARVPAVIHTPHCFHFMRSRSRLEARTCLSLERMLARWTDCFMLVSESQRTAASRLVSAVPCLVIPNGLPLQFREDPGDLNELRRELDLPQGGAVVGTLSRLTRYKCVDHFIRSAGGVRRRLPDTHFLVVGDGPDRHRLMRLVRTLGLQDAVHMVGYRRDTDRLLQLLDVCVLCSQAEGMPYVLLEAMRAGVSVVASRVPGNSDLIEDGRTGLFHEWGRVDDLSECMLRCLTDSALRDDMTRRAYLRFADRHHLKSQVEALIGLYRRLAVEAESTRASYDVESALRLIPLAKER